MTECVKVIIRSRPLIQKEIQMNCQNIVDIEKNLCQISIRKPSDPDTIKTFKYDEVYDENSLQQQVYDDAAFSLVESAAEGYNGTIFAYGQTGCGKTYSMIGDLDNEQEKGIMPKSFSHIFSILSADLNKSKQYLIRCQFIEIYNEEIRDLLNMDQNSNKKRLEIKENPNQGVYVKDCLIRIAQNSNDLLKALKDGNKNKSTGETLMNRDSSRSHCIFTVFIETQEAIKNGNQKIKMGKLNLVDLAGSEKQKKTGATGQRFKEATKINLSLSALMNVITCLVDGKSTHIPYRDSKLTRLLQDALGGNTKTCMIANISPADYNYDETLSTLRYADRAKMIKNKPKINEDPKDALLREYAEEIKRLKTMLESINTQPTPPPIVNQKNSSVSLRYSASISPQQIIKQKAKIPRDNSSSGGSIISKQLGQNSSQGGGVGGGDDEFLLSNSEFLTEGEEEKTSQLEKSHKKEENTIASSQKKRKSNHNRQGKGGSFQEEALIIQMEQEQQAKAELEFKIKELQEKLVLGGNQAQQEKQEVYRQFQIKLKQQKEREKEILKQKAKYEEDMMLVEKNYQTLQEEVEDMRKLLKKFRLKYKEAVNEIKDLNEEYTKERADLFESIQDFQKENLLFKGLLKMLLHERELNKVIAKCEYDVDNKKWEIPAFTIKEKDVVLPKMNGVIANSQISREKYKKQFIDEQKNKNVISFGKEYHQGRGGAKLERGENEDELFQRFGSVQRQMSQTSYGNWRDFSNGRKTLADFAPQVLEAEQIKKQQTSNYNNNMSNASFNSRGNSLSTLFKDNAIDNNSSCAIISNKKSKKKIKLRPLIPLGQNQQDNVTALIQSKIEENPSQLQLKKEVIVLGNAQDHNKNNVTTSSPNASKPAVLQIGQINYDVQSHKQYAQSQAQTPSGAASNSFISQKQKIHLSKKLNPIVKKNLVKQLQAHLQKDSKNLKTIQACLQPSQIPQLEKYNQMNIISIINYNTGNGGGNSDGRNGIINNGKTKDEEFN